MYRRIRMASSHALVDTCRKAGYPVEFVKNFDGSEDYNTVVVTFPFAYPEGTKLAKDMTAIDQLNEIKRLQKDWSDNSVSCTVYYRKEEIPAIRRYLEENYRFNHKSLSFLLHSEHGFQQAPYEEVTEEQYLDLVSKTTLITSINEALEFDDSAECATGACPIR
jgi:ribonucleoside-diphosphate reductase alpha chain